MPTTAAAAPAATQPPPAAEPIQASPLGAVRAFGVMLGGPLVLLVAVAAAVAHTLRRSRARRLPRPAAAAVLAAAVAYQRWMRPWMRRWGVADADLAMAPPGEETHFTAGFQHANVVRIDAPAEAVWPWVAQIGQDRGGFYSYTWLENLAGCRMRNADRIHPEWQQRAVGETVLLHPAAGLEVVRFEPGRALVFEGSWSLLVEPDGPARCRLIAGASAPGGIAGRAYAMLLELPHFLMQRRMLLAIKRRAEDAA